jgi:hypothetical protein
MRRISSLVTIFITSFVMTLAGLVASPIATASENNGGISATFAPGSSVLSDAQKAAIKKALASSGSDASFIVTGTAGKLPGVSDSKVQRLAKARAKAIKAYLVSLGVSKTSITTQVKVAEIGETPRSVGSYPAPAPTPTATAVAAASAPAAPAPTPTCATGGTCVVGDTGPGGGIVFYVNAAGFACGTTLAATCNYLEAAPTSGPSAWTDAAYAWSGNTSLNIGATAQRTAIGTGYANTSAIVLQDATESKAGTIARAYSGPNGLSDWFLPSKDELNQMCKWANAVAWTSDATPCTAGTLNAGTGHGLNAAGFLSDLYQSSSETASGPPNQAFSQAFSNGLQITGPKRNSNPVRPVRAF